MSYMTALADCLYYHRILFFFFILLLFFFFSFLQSVENGRIYKGSRWCLRSAAFFSCSYTLKLGFAEGVVTMLLMGRDAGSVIILAWKTDPQIKWNVIVNHFNLPKAWSNKSRVRLPLAQTQFRIESQFRPALACLDQHYILYGEKY